MAKTLRSGKEMSEVPVPVVVQKIILKKKHKKNKNDKKSR